MNGQYAPGKNVTNLVALTLLHFLPRSAAFYRDCESVMHGETRRCPSSSRGPSASAPTSSAAA